MKTRYKKVVRDLTIEYGKNFMLVVTIAIGVFGIGAIMGSYAVIDREMRANYMSTNPASATIEIEGNITGQILDGVRDITGIKTAERRATVRARMNVNDRWYPILIFIIDDFNTAELNMFRHESGEKEPGNGNILVERTALGVMNAADGDSLTIKTESGQPKRLKISGVVHDPSLAPAWQEQSGYAYVSMSAWTKLGETQPFNLLRLQVSENEFSSEHITTTAQTVSDWLTAHGIETHEIQVPTPGSHPHQGQVTGILKIFIIFTYMILALGAILLATSMATLMVKQVRQIGVMKTLGGTSWQIAELYVMMIVILCVIALAIAIPLGRLGAYSLYNTVAGFLNIEINDSSIPFSVTLIQTASAVLIPLIATAFPLIRASRIPVRAALDNYGVSSKRQSGLAIAISGSRIFNDTFRIAIRNAFRQRGRLTLTMILLAMGGAMFMTALNLSLAWNKTLSQIYVQRLYDQEIRLNERIETDSLFSDIRSIEGVKAVEGWDLITTSIATESEYEITGTYPDGGHGSFVMTAVPLPTALLNPRVVEGSWLKTEGSDEVVLNQGARGPGRGIGDKIVLSIDGAPTRWTIIGFTEDVGSPSTAYVSLKTFSKHVGSNGRVGMFRVAYDNRSHDYVSEKSREVDKILEARKIDVGASIPVWLLRNAVAAHMKVLINSLIAMAIMMAFVGTVGLTSTVSMNVLERTREIGVMRAIGATPKKITTLIVLEGCIVGMLSMLFAFGLSLAGSYYLGGFLGHLTFRIPLTLTISLLGIIVWIAIVLTSCIFATIFPARAANRVTTRKALAYE